MMTCDFRVALFSGNYNYVRDGANQALNRLVDHLLRRGAAVRVYSPTTDTPAFPPAGDLVSVPSVPIPGGRGEYRLATHLPRQIRDDVRDFQPDIIHVSSPDFVGHEASELARDLDIPVVASMHTRFETYLRYYGLGFLEGAATGILRRFYRRCDIVVAPSPSTAQLMQEQAMGDRIGIWARGIDRGVFSPGQRDEAWRSALAGDPDTPVIGFLGRLVMEKGLDVVCAALALAARRGVKFRTVVIGEGPARAWLERELPDAQFCGHLSGQALGRAVASLDLLFNPSVTESFGNVTLEAMASGLPVVAARASGSDSLVIDGVTGRLIAPGDIAGFADALEHYCRSAAARTTDGAAAVRAAEAYDWEAVNDRMVGVYRAAMRRTPPDGRPDFV